MGSEPTEQGPSEVEFMARVLEHQRWQRRLVAWVLALAVLLAVLYGVVKLSQYRDRMERIKAQQPATLNSDQ